MCETIELVDNNVEVEVTQNLEVSVDSNALPVEVGENVYEVTFNRNEFQVIGDSIYIPTASAEDAPWLVDLIDGQVTASYQGNLDNLTQATTSLNDQIALAENAKTAYESSIILGSDITAAIDTLRIELMGSSGTVTTALATKVTEDEATTIANTAISASIDGGDISAKVGELNTAIANGDGANASRIEVVESTVNDPITGLEATATGVQTLETTIGTTGGTGLIADVEVLQKQNDGKIETFANTYQVVDGQRNLIPLAEPYNSWLTSEATDSIDVRLSHIGDSYIEYVVNGDGSKQYVASYKFIRTEVDDTSPDKTDTEGFTWALITDTATQEAFTAALNAQATADGKITTFFAPRSNPPLAEGEGDIWVVSDEGNLLERWNGLVWVNIQDQGISSALSNAQTAQDTADGKIESFYQVSPPVTASEGDLWFDTDDGNKIYTYRSNTWTNTQDSEIGVALLNAASAQSTADGKITTFYQPTAPIAEGVGDLWVNTGSNNEAYRWDGASWVSIKDQDVVANSTALTEIDAYLRDDSGNVGGATSSVEQSIDTKVLDGDLSVQSKWEYNSNINIGGVYYNSGFGLRALATGGDGSEGDPYDSEFWVDAEKFKFTNSNQTGQVSPFTIDASGVTPKVTFNGVVSLGGLNVDSNSTSISANKLTTNSVWSDGVMISANFNGNNIGNIGSPTTGFRLAGNAAGTDSDPNIYGGYIKAGTIKSTLREGGELVTVENSVCPPVSLGVSNRGLGSTEYSVAIESETTIGPSMYLGLDINGVLDTKGQGICIINILSALKADIYIDTQAQTGDDNYGLYLSGPHLTSDIFVEGIPGAHLRIPLSVTIPLETVCRNGELLDTEANNSYIRLKLKKTTGTFKYKQMFCTITAYNTLFTQRQNFINAVANSRDLWDT